jgi:succinate dehydrogenase flavin-adding protein (antitoxin of CptAB toxin-antitoxin module)
MDDTFAQNRDKLSSSPKDINTYKKLIMHRSKFIGTSELEVLLTDWLKLSMSEMTYDDLEQFESVVFNIENDQLKRYLVSCDPLLPEHDKPIMRTLQDYVRSNKRDYEANIPKPG